MSIGDYFNQIGTIYTLSSKDQYNKPSFSAGVSVKCRLQKSKNLNSIPGGDEQTHMYDAVTYVPSSTVVVVEDVIVIESDRYEVVDIYSARSKSAHHHTKLFIKRTLQ